MLVTYSIIVSGKVQGVFYRQSTKETARSIGVTGMVSNQPEGSVKIIATGTKDQLEELIKWCYQGPPKAQVDTVVVTEMALRVFHDFTISR